MFIYLAMAGLGNDVMYYVSTYVMYYETFPRDFAGNFIYRALQEPFEGPAALQPWMI